MIATFHVFEQLDHHFVETIPHIELFGNVEALQKEFWKWFSILCIELLGREAECDINVLILISILVLEQLVSSHRSLIARSR